MMEMITFKTILKLIGIFLMTYSVIKAVLFMLFDNYEERTMRPSIYYSIFALVAGLAIFSLSNLSPGNILYDEMEAFLDAANHTWSYPIVIACTVLGVLCGVANIVIDIIQNIRYKKHIRECVRREEILTVCEALNRWSDEGITVKDVVILADKPESEE